MLTFNNIINYFSKFCTLEYYQLKTPKSEAAYYYLAVGIYTLLISIISLDKQFYFKHENLILLLSSIIFTISTAFVCNRLWPEDFRKKYIGIIWYCSIFIFVFISSFFALLSNFENLSMVVFILNMSMVAFLLPWKESVSFISIGTVLALLAYYVIIGDEVVPEHYSFNIKVFYALFIFSSFILAFIKPKQEELDEKEANLLYALKQNKVLDEAAINAMSTGQKILDNFSSEMRNAVGTVTQTSLLLDLFGNQLPEKAKTLVQYIDKDARRLSKMIIEMTRITDLIRNPHVVNYDEVNMTELLEERIARIRKFYVPDELYQHPEIMKELEEIQNNLNNLRPEQRGRLALTTQTLTNHYRDVKFEVDLEPEVIIKCDLELITNAIDNVIENAVKFTAKGTVRIRLASDKYHVIITVEDQGPGVPSDELYTIFDPFIIASNTQANTGGRGIGLTLSAKVIEAHQGTIKADRCAPIGMRFTIKLPKKTYYNE